MWPSSAPQNESAGQRQRGSAMAGARHADRHHLRAGGRQQANLSPRCWPGAGTTRGVGHDGGDAMRRPGRRPVWPEADSARLSCRTADSRLQEESPASKLRCNDLQFPNIRPSCRVAREVRAARQATRSPRRHLCDGASFMVHTNCDYDICEINSACPMEIPHDTIRAKSTQRASV